MLRAQPIIWRHHTSTESALFSFAFTCMPTHVSIAFHLGLCDHCGWREGVVPAVRTSAIS